MSNNLPVEVAIAILPRDGKFLMQLRDNISTILYPGLWGFFGGHIEQGETPEIAVKREILEEISYDLEEPKFFAHYNEPHVIRHIFYAPLTVDLDKLVLGEGWDFGLLTPEQIKAGFAYSEIAQEERPIGLAHQQILIDFMNWW